MPFSLFCRSASVPGALLLLIHLTIALPDAASVSFQLSTAAKLKYDKGMTMSHSHLDILPSVPLPHNATSFTLSSESPPSSSSADAGEDLWHSPRMPRMDDSLVMRHRWVFILVAVAVWGTCFYCFFRQGSKSIAPSPLPLSATATGKVRARPTVDDDFDDDEDEDELVLDADALEKAAGKPHAHGRHPHVRRGLSRAVERVDGGRSLDPVGGSRHIVDGDDEDEEAEAEAEAGAGVRVVVAKPTAAAGRGVSPPSIATAAPTVFVSSVVGASALSTATTASLSRSAHVHATHATPRADTRSPTSPAANACTNTGTHTGTSTHTHAHTHRDTHRRIDREESPDSAEESNSTSAPGSAEQLMIGVLREMRVPDYSMPVHTQLLRDSWLSTVDQLLAMDDDDWARLELPDTLLTHLRRRLETVRERNGNGNRTRDPRKAR